MNASVVREAERMLFEVRKEFLQTNGWAEKNGRWARDFVWGTESTRRVEADFIDAVNFQLEIEESREGK